MDVFQLRNRLVEDYSSYIRSFIQIRDEKSIASSTRRYPMASSGPIRSSS